MFLIPSACDGTARPALIDSKSERTWTYEALSHPIQQIAERIHTPQKRLIFHFCANNIESVLSYLAGCEAGHAVALLDSGMRPEFAVELFKRYRPDLVFSDGAFTLDSIADMIDGQYVADPEGIVGIRLWRRIGGEEEPLHQDLAVLLSTSGTTGSPKFVRWSRRNVESNADAIRLALSIDAVECPISSLPMFYSYGLSVINSHLVAGATIVLTTEPILSREFWGVFRKFRCTSFAGVPYAYEMLARFGLEQFDLPTLMTLTQAGGKLHNDLILRFHRYIAGRRGRFFVMYGQTEATARMAYLPPEYLPEKVGAIGFAIPNGTLDIQREKGRICAPYRPGEVIYRGPNVMMGYATRREDLAEGDQLKGCLDTGDQGYFDEERFFYITGRTKRIAKIFGLRVNLDEVEQLIRQHGPAAVVGAQDSLVIFCERGDEEFFQRSRQYLSSRLKLHHRVFDFRYVTSLPLTSNGKIDYTALLQAL